MAKLILTDNYNRDTIADILIESNLSDEEAERKANDYNERNHNDWFAKVVTDDYRLWGGMKELCRNRRFA